MSLEIRTCREGVTESLKEGQPGVERALVGREEFRAERTRTATNPAKRPGKWDFRQKCQSGGAGLEDRPPGADKASDSGAI